MGETAEKSAEKSAETSAENPKEEPALYWVYRSKRSDVHKLRRDKRKKRKLEKQAKEGSGDDVEESGAEEATQDRKRKQPDDAVEEVADDAIATEKNSANSGKKAGNKNKKPKVEQEELVPPEEVTEKAEEPEKKKPADDTDEEEEGPSMTEKERSMRPAGFFSKTRFDELPICDNLKKALQENKFETLTEIQDKSIPYLLEGKDVLAAAKTGSGKTLSFLIPALDLLYNVKFLPRNGVGAMVISPVRELAMQIYDVLRTISQHMSQTIGICVGGTNRKQECDKLVKGVNILVATPGRLLDHMQNTKGFVFHNLVNLTIDEADRILEVGFEDEMNMIVKLLPKKRQTALFSATQTRKVADLARLSLTKPVFVEVKSQDNVSTVSGLTQGYVVCPAQSRFLLLFTFLKRNRDKKIMVFFSSCNAVKFYDELLNYIDVPVIGIHGQKKQASRSTVYYNFCSAEKGILLCTDVAARGLDIPKVDWIVQFDPPDEPKEYIHRVGRTARGASGIGKALLFLMPEELPFLSYLRTAGVPVAEYSFPPNKIASIQGQLERVIEKNYHLHKSSRDAYRSYMHAYAAHCHKDVFDVHKLDLAQLAKSFGFAAPPKVELNLKHAPRNKKGAKGVKGKMAAETTGHLFSAANPYGKRGSGDKRQFVR